MEQKTVDFPSKRMLAQLDRIRGCHTCKEKKGCDRYNFASDATDAIIKESGFQKSFLGQYMARNLSWAMAEEAYLSGIVDEGDDELYYESEPQPLLYALESVREHIREMMKILLEMQKRS